MVLNVKKNAQYKKSDCTFQEDQPLFSTILMLAIPAKIAGCEEIVLCSPNNEGQLPMLFCTITL